MMQDGPLPVDPSNIRVDGGGDRRVLTTSCAHYVGDRRWMLTATMMAGVRTGRRTERVLCERTTPLYEDLPISSATAVERSEGLRTQREHFI
eukprot:scaffold29742_cov80-Cyclotella_meneghiniana.AAC.2